MRFDEPDVREAYRCGARDCYESMILKAESRKSRDIEKWLDELENWQDGDPPQPPLGEVG